VTNTAKDSEGKMTKTFGNIGKAVITAFSVKAIVDFGKKLIESSANIQAMEAQFDQVFKTDNAQAVEGIAKQVDDLGIHADRLAVSWNKFGGQVKGAGMDGEQALAAVDKATRLAADSAAFYDTSLENSSASLASFMKSNFEAGDAIGVFTNAKQMDVKSNEMYGKSWADLNEAERQWLLLDTVEKTYEMNGAMGQATRESGAYENTMGNLKATFERFYSVVGAPVLDGFLVVVGKVTEKAVALTEKIQNGESIFNGFGDAVNWVKSNMDIILPVLGGVTAAIAAQLIVNTVSKGYQAFKLATEGTTAAQVILNAVMGANPFGIVAIAIGLLVTAGIALYKNWDTVSAKAIEIKNNIIGAWDNLRTKTVEAWNNIKTDITDTVTGLVDDAVDWGKNLVTGLWNGITDRAGWLKDKVYGFVEGIGSTITDFFGIQSPSTLMAEYGRYIDEGLAQGIENNAHLPLGALGSIASNMVSNIDSLLSKINTFDKLSDSEKSIRRSEYNSQKNNFYDANQDEINAISKQHGVDLSVAQDMLRENLLSGIPKYANGTNFHPGGLAWVGDHDKELVSLPRGTQVFNEQQIGNMINQRPVELHLHIGNYIGDDYSLKKFGQKIRQIIADENERLGVNSI
jgi:hypothetical protein